MLQASQSKLTMVSQGQRLTSYSAGGGKIWKPFVCYYYEEVQNSYS